MHHTICRFIGKSAIHCLLLYLLQEFLLIKVVQNIAAVYRLGNKQAHILLDIIFCDDLIGYGISFHFRDLTVHSLGVLSPFGKINGVEG